MAAGGAYGGGLGPGDVELEEDGGKAGLGDGIKYLLDGAVIGKDCFREAGIGP